MVSIVSMITLDLVTVQSFNESLNAAADGLMLLGNSDSPQRLFPASKYIQTGPDLVILNFLNFAATKNVQNRLVW